MNEFVQQFLIESRELAEQATAGLLALERAPQDAEQLDAVFRAVHTLKGGAGIVDFVAMERAVHAAEDLLSAARAGRCVLDPQMVGHCLACIDLVLQWLDIIEQTGELPPASCEAEANHIIARITSTLPGADAAPAIIPQLQKPATSTGRLPQRARSLLAAQLELARTANGSYGHLASAAFTASNVMRACGQQAEAAELARLASGNADAMLSPLQLALTRLLVEESTDTSAASAAGAQVAAPRNSTSTSGTNSRTLRIGAERIDALVRLTGELTVARNALAHVAKLAASEGNALAPALKAQQATFDSLIGELQRSVLTLRVLPLRVVFQRFPRLLHEMSDTLGKPATLEMAGEDTEADKTIVEMLFEPLLHVLRNAMDHGVEAAALRAQRGKSRVATIGMRARRQGDQVLVEISDDGGGIDVQRVRKVAAQRGVAAADKLDVMPDTDVIDLVFAPGFSTAAEVTALSGRGVGMDAVRTAVERFGGRVSIHSQAGQGTTVRFLLPFSVMMTTVMSVEAGGQMFGVPLDAVVETIRVPRSAVAAVGQARALVVRGQTIPVFDLSQMLGDTGKGQHGEEATIVITAFAGQRCGLDVDALGERLDVILKPLEGLLAGTPGITGTTLLGDGRVLLVLDIAELLQ